MELSLKVLSKNKSIKHYVLFYSFILALILLIINVFADSVPIISRIPTYVHIGFVFLTGLLMNLTREHVFTGKLIVFYSDKITLDGKEYLLSTLKNIKIIINEIEGERDPLNWKSISPQKGNNNFLIFNTDKGKSKVEFFIEDRKIVKAIYAICNQWNENNIEYRLVNRFRKTN